MKTLILSCGLLFATTVSAGDVLLTRSMEMMELGPASYLLTCNLEYTGVDPTHTYDVNLGASGFGLNPYPYGGQMSPGQRRIVIDDPGVTRFTATLRRNVLRVERILYITGEVPATTTFYCQGGVADLTTGGGLGSVLMSDIFR
jgi:hypothetical protein